MQPDYTLKLAEGKEIPLLFNYAALRQYATSRSLEHDDLKLEIARGRAMGKLPEIMFAGHQGWCKANNQECKLTLDDFFAVMDDLEHFTKDHESEVFIIYVARVTRQTVEAVRKLIEDDKEEKESDEKKSQTT